MAKFCSECAAPLGSASQGPKDQADSPQDARVDAQGIAGERRHLTVLFCDLVGSMGIAANLDPEDWREIVTSYHRTATESIARFGGYLAQLLGDGLLVYFGYPQAHEDDPQRAVLSALAILDAMTELNSRIEKRQGPRLAVRIGIHSGPVVVDESNGKGANIFGDVPNVASRVQTAAAPDTVSITADVHHLVSGLFLVEDRGSQALKGIERPIRLYRVLQPSGARGRLAAAAVRGLTPFIGREDELRLLLNRWNRTCEGEGQVILVLGEPGIGKSRLVQCFNERIADVPHTLVECAAAPMHQNTPFYIVEDLLQQGLRWRGEQSADERTAGLESSLKMAGLDLGEAVPLIAPLMNLTIPAKYAPRPMPADQQRKQMLATIVAWALGTARIQPLIIVIEDLHWADPSTLEVIQLLAEQNAMAPLLLLCTARPEFRAPWPLRAHHTLLTLNRLSARDARDMVTRLTADSAVPSDMVEAVVERGVGVPLFLEELARSVLERGGSGLAAHEIPATLRDLLMARLDRLQEARETAQLAAVIGHEFSWKLLSAIAGMEDERLTSALKKLANADLVLEQGVPPEANYRFRHALIQDAAYQSLLRTKRQDCHRRIAEVLEKRFPQVAEAQPQVLAYHYGEANRPHQAIAYWQAAGQKAIQRSANAEAVSQFRRALELLKTLPETPERLQMELALQLGLGTPLIANTGFASADVGKAYARARELCQRVGQAPQLFPVLWGLWVFYTARAEHETAHDLAKQCLRLAETVHEPFLTLEAHHALGVSLTALAQFAPALEHLDYVINRHDPSQQGALAFGQDPKVVCLSQAAWTLWIHGYPDQALKRNHEAVTLAQQLSHPYTLAAALDFGSMVHQLNQDVQATETLADAAIKLSTEHGFAYWMAWGSIMRGWATSQGPEGEEGLVQIRDGIAAFRATGANVMVPYFLGLLADAYRQVGQCKEGLAVLAEARELVEISKERWWEAELCRLKGEMILDQHDTRKLSSTNEKGAEDCFREALNVAARQGAKSLELRAAMSLNRLWQKQGKKAGSHDMLTRVYGRFTEGFDTADLREAKVSITAAS